MADEPTFNGVPIKWVENLADAPLILIQERLTIDDLKTGCRYNNAALDDLRRSYASAECTRPAADAVLS